MKLTKLRLEDFRNLVCAERSVDAPFVVLFGENAQGKTNVLEAVHVLLTLKPLESNRTAQLIRFGAARCGVAGTVSFETMEARYAVRLAPGDRRQWVNGAPVQDLTEYFGGLALVAHVPADEAIVTGEPSRRRTWLDRAAFTASVAHLEVVRRVRRCLQQKSAALKEPGIDPALLDVLDDQLAVAGGELAQRRARVLEELGPHIERNHGRIAGEQAPVVARYRSQATGRDAAERSAALREALSAARADEIDRGIALVGPQRDDVLLEIEGRPARTYASRGQVRSLVLALKLAEVEAARERGQRPVFLLDDVGGELDPMRTKRLVETLAQCTGQVFATTTDQHHLAALPAADTLWFRVKGGELEQT